MPRRKRPERPPDLPSGHYLRTIDELGRVVVPAQVRRQLGLGDASPVELFVDGDRVYLVPYRESCLFCGRPLDVGHFRGKPLCRACAQELAHLAARGEDEGEGEAAASADPAPSP
jgi:transcriptional pleiotropic regulator of transition state genes